MAQQFSVEEPAKLTDDVKQRKQKSFEEATKHTKIKHQHELMRQKKNIVGF